MTDKIVDFQSKKDTHLHKRKEAKVDAMRKAFSLARDDKKPAKVLSITKKRKKSKKKK